MSKPLDFEPEKMLIQIRPDQANKLEQIKYEWRCNNGIKVPKTEIIRTALDNLFKLDISEILNLVELNRDN
jgi:hypothetical protein